MCVFKILPICVIIIYIRYTQIELNSFVYLKWLQRQHSFLRLNASSFTMCRVHVMLVIAVASNNIYINEAAKILALFPMPCISHQFVFRPYIHELLKRGHEVTVLTTDPAYSTEQTPTNLTEIDLHDVSYKVWTQYLNTLTYKLMNNDIQKFIENYIRVYLKIAEEQAQVAEVKNIIKEKVKTFDMILVEASARFALGFSHIINVPVITISSFGVPFFNYEVMGAPIHPLLYPYPSVISKPFYELSLRQKISQYCKFFSVANEYNVGEELEDDFIRKTFGEDSSDLSELQNNVQRMLLNIHPLWEGIRPVPPSVIHIGGLHHSSQQELPQELQQYLDSSVHGVIYISFGTTVVTSVLDTDKIHTIIKVFSQMPYDVLWKWDQDELPGRTNNIRVSKWFPQPSLLRHPKIKLFITHGGLHSTEESIMAGVPLIGIPFFIDQWFNTKKYEQHKIGLQLKFLDLEVDSLMVAIKTVIGDLSYRENVIRLKALLTDRPVSSLARAVWCTEHVLRHGSNASARYFRAPASNMHWAEYFELKLASIILSITIVASVAALVLIRSMVKFFMQSCFKKRKPIIGYR